jgi:hypothetical protein
MSNLTAIFTDLRERRLWPLALALAAALVAVPVLLSSSTKTAPPSLPAQATPAPSPAAALPAVSVSSTPIHSHLKAKARDPFIQPHKATSAARTGGAGASPTGTSSSPGSSTSAHGGTGHSSTGQSSTPTSTTTPTTTTLPTNPPKPEPAPTGLTATQSYHVTLAITNSAGGFDTIDPLERLSVLPSRHQPLLVDLGVLKGGRRVVFVVQPGTVVSGPGTCTPGPIDCEVLSLAPNQIETLSKKTPSGVVSVAGFSVTAISADRHPSAAGADKARRMASAVGRDLLSSSTLTTPSLFRYEPSLGAVVDLRNLSVGGS